MADIDNLPGIHSLEPFRYLLKNPQLGISKRQFSLDNRPIRKELVSYKILKSLFFHFGESVVYRVIVNTPVVFRHRALQQCLIGNPANAVAKLFKMAEISIEHQFV